MKTYLRNEIIYPKNSYIHQVFKIIKGHITTKEKNIIYKPNDYLFLDQIFYNPISLTEYIALDLVVGEWIDKEQIDMSYFLLLSKMYQEKKNQTELLLIQDPITKIARYLYFEYQNKKTESFYLTLSITELSAYLNISKANISEAIHFLNSREIIAKHNQLFNILNIKKLEEYAYIKDC